MSSPRKKPTDMEDQLTSPPEEDLTSSSKTGNSHWWRSSTNFKEFSNLIYEINTSTSNSSIPAINLSQISPKIKIVREMERLAMVAQEAGVGELRHKLYNYRCGDFWVPIGGVKKEDLDIPPVNTILLVGFHNAGKSSVVNLMYSVLGRCGVMPFVQTNSGNANNYPNLFMEEHNVLRLTRSGFCVYDSRGFEYDQAYDFVNELSHWVTDGIHHKQLCLTPGDSLTIKQEMLENNYSCNSYLRYARRRVNCVMVVVNVAEVGKGLKDGDKKPLEAVKELFCSPALRRRNENPILVLTHGDELTTEDRIESRQRICEYLGVSESTGVYDITCVTEYGFVADECDQVTACTLTEAVYRALLVSDRNHLPKKKFIDRALISVYWLMFCIGSFFAFLARIFSSLGGRHKI